MVSHDLLRQILAAHLGPSYPPSFFKVETPLLGAVPELDSMAVVGILAAIEESTGITIADDEISADAFATFGTLAAFVDSQTPGE